MPTISPPQTSSEMSRKAVANASGGRVESDTHVVVFDPVEAGQGIGEGREGQGEAKKLGGASHFLFRRAWISAGGSKRSLGMSVSNFTVSKVTTISWPMAV